MSAAALHHIVYGAVVLKLSGEKYLFYKIFGKALAYLAVGDSVVARVNHGILRIGKIVKDNLAVRAKGVADHMGDGNIFFYIRMHCLPALSQSFALI